MIPQAQRASGAIQYAELAEALTRLGLADEPSEYHGALCGALCVLDPEDVPVLRLLEVDEDSAPEPDPQAQALLRRLSQQAFEALLSNQMIFAPLLPDDEEVLGRRAQALAHWCQGFLFGLASQQALDLGRCSAEAREIIQDLGQFTQADVGSEDNEDMEERAYSELVEYIRVGAQLVFMELHPKSEGEAAPTLH